MHGSSLLLWHFLFQLLLPILINDSPKNVCRGIFLLKESLPLFVKVESQTFPKARMDTRNMKASILFILRHSHIDFHISYIDIPVLTHIIILAYIYWHSYNDLHRLTYSYNIDVPWDTSDIVFYHWRRPLMIVLPSGSFTVSRSSGIPSYNLQHKSAAASPRPPSQPPSPPPCYAFAMSRRNNYRPKSISNEDLDAPRARAVFFIPMC